MTRKMILESLTVKTGWLHSSRQAYAALTTVLEEHVLSLSEDDLVGASEDYHATRDTYQHWLTLDERLVQVPSPLPMVNGPDFYVDYIYVIDLDREIFSISLGAHFKLDQIPRRGLWRKAIQEDRDEIITISSSICPSASIASPQFVPPGPDDRFRGWQGDDPLELRRVPPIDLVGHDNIHPSSEDSVQMTISMRVLYNFTSKFHGLLEGYLREWSPESFIFREMVFAILSIASGQMRFQAGDWLQGHRIEPYLVMDDHEVRQGNPRLLPIFPKGFHRPDHEPGSSPAETMYWFDGVLIGLAAMIDDPTQREVAVANLVRFGRDHRPRGEFDGLIISIEHVLLIRVRNPRHGTRPEVDVTDPIPLFEINSHLAIDPRHRPAVRPASFAWTLPLNDRDGSVGYVPRACTGFPCLVRFLDQAISRALPSSASPNHGRFPAEIYQIILDQVDDPTYLSCARACRRFRLYCHAHLRLGRGLIVTRNRNPVRFVVEDRDNGETAAVYESHLEFIHDQPDWAVVIGSLDRPSLLVGVGISFQKLDVKRDPEKYPRYYLKRMQE